MDDTRLSFYYNNCTTDALEPDDERYVDIPDILTAIVHGTERVVLQHAEGIDPDQALVDGYGKRLWA